MKDMDGIDVEVTITCPNCDYKIPLRFQYLTYHKYDHTFWLYKRCPNCLLEIECSSRKEE